MEIREAFTQKVACHLDLELMNRLSVVTYGVWERKPWARKRWNRRWINSGPVRIRACMERPLIDKGIVWSHCKEALTTKH